MNTNNPGIVAYFSLPRNLRQCVDLYETAKEKRLIRRTDREIAYAQRKRKIDRIAKESRRKNRGR